MLDADRMRAYMRVYRARPTGAHIAQNQKVAANRREKTEFIRFYKAESGCIDCGETDWVVLDLDHREPSDKRFGPNTLSYRSWETLKAEIRKCDVRCANCHRRRTFREKHWVCSSKVEHSPLKRSV